jgi:hypothetical protein
MMPMAVTSAARPRPEPPRLERACGADYNDGVPIGMNARDDAQPLAPHPVAEALLDEWRPRLGPDRVAYGNHVHRVFHLARRLGGLDASHDEPLAITSAFHDAAIWLDDTFDYLVPSAARAAAHLDAIGRATWVPMVTAAIDAHHKLTPWSGPDAPFVEGFRRADWLDFMLFALPTTVPRAFLRDLLAAFPRAGFHARIVRIAGGWARRHPMRPFPMLRW